MIKSLDQTLIFLLVVACAPCQPWAELAVVDPEGLESQPQLDAIQAGIDRLFGWTGRAETCVRKIEIKRDLTLKGEPVLGYFQHRQRRVRLTADTPVEDLDDNAIHELCHSLDWEAGWPSVDHPEIWSAVVADLEPTPYDTPTLRSREGFALICQGGPVDLSLLDAWAGSCAVDLVDEATRFVNEMAFPETSTPGLVGHFSATTSWTTLDIPDRTGRLPSVPMAPGALGLYFVVADSGIDDDHPVDYPTLFAVDPVQGLVLDDLDLGRSGTQAVWSLLGSSTNPILVNTSTDKAWRVHANPLSLEPIRFAAFDRDSPVTGFARGSEALVRGLVDGEDIIARIDLDTGELMPMSTDRALANGQSLPKATWFDEEGLLAVVDEEGFDLVAFDWDGSRLWSERLPGDPTSVELLVRRSEGRVLVAPVVSIEDEGGDVEQHALPLGFDPATAQRSVPVGACDGWVATGGWTEALGATARILPVETTHGSFALEVGVLSITP